MVSVGAEDQTRLELPILVHRVEVQTEGNAEPVIVLLIYRGGPGVLGAPHGRRVRIRTSTLFDGRRHFHNSLLEPVHQSGGSVDVEIGERGQRQEHRDDLTLDLSSTRQPGSCLGEVGVEPVGLSHGLSEVVD